MSEAKSKRKLAAILSADVVSYSRLMANDEAATVETLTQYRSEIGNVVERHQGRIVNAPGDNILAEFASAVEAVRAAVEIQRSIQEKNADLSEERRMRFRVGVNLGDIIEQADGTIYGDGVNIAARLEALADEGGICISSTIHDAVEGKLDFGFEFLGERPVKNIEKPVWVYRLRGEPGEKAYKRVRGKTAQSRLVIAAVAVLIVTIVAIVVWKNGTGPSQTESAKPDDPLLAMPGGPSIAVLPFENLSARAEQDYFADGMTEDIITGLSRFRDLLVIARNSTLQYKRKAVDVREVGRDLGVRFVLQGSVRRDADNIRVTIQLLDANSGAHIWAETFDRTLSAGNVFAIQDEVAEHVVAQIADAYGAISEFRKAEVRAAPPGSLGAYECVLLVYEFFRVLNAEMHAKARDCLQSAVKTDPNYADAWAWLTGLYNEEYVDDLNPLPNSLNRALDAGLTALELDANNQIAHWFLAWNYYFRRDLEKFEQHADRALSINPNNATMLAELSMPFAWIGNTEKAEGMVRKAMRINPRFPGFYYFTLYHIHAVQGDYEQAAADAQRLNLPDLFWMHAKAATAYGHLGRTAEARAAIDKLLELYPDFGNKAREELESIYWPNPEYIERYIDGLRKAGLEIADKPSGHGLGIHRKSK